MNFVKQIVKWKRANVVHYLPEGLKLGDTVVFEYEQNKNTGIITSAYEKGWCTVEWDDHQKTTSKYKFAFLTKKNGFIFIDPITQKQLLLI